MEGHTFVKVLAPNGYTFDEPVLQMIKIAAAGLHGHDLREFVKRAGHQFADAVGRLDVKPGEQLVHLIALGSTEDYGPNRNGDGFKRAACRKYHDTFVKFARWYRNHDNKNPANSYGHVKLSSFNERMKRIELLVSLNATKEAAERNGGFVADEELEKLARGDDIPVSMACRVPYDICSGCGNRARNRKEYCLGIEEGGLCKDGGLRNNITRCTGNDDNPILHADNTEPAFFDISRVPRNADRIAFTFGTMKAAGGQILSGAQLAEELGVTAPADLAMTGELAEMLQLAHKFAAAEAAFERSPADRWALAFVGQPRVSWSDHEGRLGDVLQALTLSKIAMPIEGFLEVIGRDPVKAANAAQATRPFLPGIYTKLVKSGELASLLETNPFVVPEKLAPLAVRRWAETKAADYSLARQQADRRVMLAAVRQHGLPSVRPTTIKLAGASSEVAKHYALYKLAFVHALAARDEDLDLTVKLCVAQNYL